MHTTGDEGLRIGPIGCIPILLTGNKYTRKYHIKICTPQSGEFELLKWFTSLIIKANEQFLFNKNSILLTTENYEGVNYQIRSKRAEPRETSGVIRR